MNGTPSPTFLALQGALAGRYALERELGRGGMGIVYLARDLSLDRPVAIKLLPPALAAVPRLRERFLREARTAARLSHPNIVPIHSVEEHGEFVLFVMGYIDGETLAERIARRGPLAIEPATRLLQEVAWALAYAHQHGVIHRDIKPENILLERAGGRALVSDFGIAQVETAEARTGSGEVVGTVRYMSPEQQAGRPVDRRSDVYSLGVTARRALEGRNDLPPRLLAIVEKCTAPAPDDRFPDAETLAGTLGGMLTHRSAVPEQVARFVDALKTLRLEVSSYLAIVLVLGAESLALRNWQGVLFLNILVYAVFVMVGLFALRGSQLMARGRKLLGEGYTMADVRAALLRPEEAPDEADEEPVKVIVKIGGVRRTVAWAARIAVSGLLLWAWVAELVWWSGSERGPLLDGLLFAAFTLFPIVLVRGVLTRVMRPGRKGWWSRFWWRVLEKKLLWMAGARGKEGRRMVGNEPTEMALAAGANELFEAMPRAMQDRFSEVPRVLERLEAQAARLRGSGADLDGERLASTLAAMEHLRLDLLRLKVGAGSPNDLTSDLEAARQLGQRIDGLLDAFREVEAGLRTPTPVT
jgi:serine/threonine protein kinase